MSVPEVDGVSLDALNYTVEVPYNGTGATGADPLDFDVNVWYQVRPLVHARPPMALL